MGWPAEIVNVNLGLSTDRPIDRPKKRKPATEAGLREI